MLKKVECDEVNYEKKLFFYVSKGGIENKKRIKIVSDIINDVKKNKNKALLKYSKKFDNNFFTNEVMLKVSEKEISDGVTQCSKDFQSSIKIAIKRITNYQKRMMERKLIE